MVAGWEWVPAIFGRHFQPDGWTSASLYTKKVGKNYKDVVLFGGVDHFFTLPREIGTNKDNKIIAVYADDFHYSASKKWISFIVSPTAKLWIRNVDTVEFYKDL